VSELGVAQEFPLIFFGSYVAVPTGHFFAIFQGERDYPEDSRRVAYRDRN
jgi:hypothetical protein